MWPMQGRVSRNSACFHALFVKMRRRCYLREMNFIMASRGHTSQPERPAHPPCMEKREARAERSCGHCGCVRIWCTVRPLLHRTRLVLGITGKVREIDKNVSLAFCMLRLRWLPVIIRCRYAYPGTASLLLLLRCVESR